MTDTKFTTKDVGILPHWKSIHHEHCLLQYVFSPHGNHPVYFKWEEISDLKIKHIDSILECVFKLNLAEFGLPGHEIPVMNFLNDEFQWLVYKIDKNNKILAIDGHSRYSGITKIEDDASPLIPYNHCNYATQSTTAPFRGQFLSVVRNQDAPLLRKLTKKEARQKKFNLFKIQFDDPEYHLVAFDDDGKSFPQDDVYNLFKTYSGKYTFKDYFGALPNRNQNCFEIPFINGKEMPFVGQFNDSMFGGFDTYNFIFYDKGSRTVAIFQQTT